MIFYSKMLAYISKDGMLLYNHSIIVTLNKINYYFPMSSNTCSRVTFFLVVPKMLSTAGLFKRGLHILLICEISAVF